MDEGHSWRCQIHSSAFEGAFRLLLSCGCSRPHRGLQQAFAELVCVLRVVIAQVGLSRLPLILHPRRRPQFIRLTAQVIRVVVKALLVRENLWCSLHRVEADHLLVPGEDTLRHRSFDRNLILTADELVIRSTVRLELSACVGHANCSDFPNLRYVILFPSLVLYCTLDVPRMTRVVLATEIGQVSAPNTLWTTYETTDDKRLLTQVLLLQCSGRLMLNLPWLNRQNRDVALY